MYFNPFPQRLLMGQQSTTFENITFENIVGKNLQFLLFPQYFLTCLKSIPSNHQIALFPIFKLGESKMSYQRKD